MLKFIFFVPESHLEVVKQTVFLAGAGHTDNYEQCCWQVLGQGQFRPLLGSNPFLGSAGEVEQVSEYRVEMVCEDALVSDVVAALKDAHPYEEPAYDIIQLQNI